MKITKICILIAIVTLIQLKEYVYSQNNMPNNSLTIPLEIGRNPPVQFENLVIEPVNLYIQSNPLDNSSPSIQLEINVTEDDVEYSAFLGYNKTNAYQNYPKALGYYVFALEVSKSEVALVVEKSSFGKPFFIDIGQKAVIGNLSIHFEECITEWSYDEHFNYTDQFSTYYVLLSDNIDRKTLEVMSLFKYEENELLLAWKDYEIWILYDAQKILKLMVDKKE